MHVAFVGEASQPVLLLPHREQEITTSDNLVYAIFRDSVSIFDPFLRASTPVSINESLNHQCYLSIGDLM